MTPELASDPMTPELASDPMTPEPASLAAPPADDEHDVIHAQAARRAKGAGLKRKDRTVRRCT